MIDVAALQPHPLLRFDSGAGLTVGLAFLLLHDPVAWLYGMPVELVLLIGTANAVYGTYSGALAWRWPAVPRAALVGLVLANAAWPLACLAILAVHGGELGALGVIHVVLEALFVGGLAAVERRVLLR